MRNKPVSLGRLTTLNWFRLSGDKVGLAKAFLWMIKMKIKKRHESRAQFITIFAVMFAVMVVAFHNLMHGGYAPLWSGVFIGGMIGLTREVVLRHRAKKMAKVKGHGSSK